MVDKRFPADFDMVIKALNESPLAPEVDWALALSVATLRALDSRLPGFSRQVQERLRLAAAQMEASVGPGQAARALDLHALVDSWVFTE